MGKSNNNDKKEKKAFCHALRIVPLLSYENIFSSSIHSANLSLFFDTFFFQWCEVGGQITHFNEICLLTLPVVCLIDLKDTSGMFTQGQSCSRRNLRQEK